jgi:predicted transcriptional regulator
LAAGTEVGKYRLLAVFFLPLYTRLHKEEVLDNETRGMIRGYIHAVPGVHYNEILRHLRLQNGVAIHHLSTLEREGYIQSRNDGRLKRFYPAGMKLSEAPPILDRIQRTIYDTLRENDGLSQREIARLLDISSSSVSRHINRMASLGVVRLERQGMRVRCYLVNGSGLANAGERKPDPSVHEQPPQAH